MAVVGILVVCLSGLAAAQESCSRVVVMTLPGVTWSDIRRVEPPAIESAIEMGSAGSISVRTNSSRTSLASGFATIGAGARVDGGVTTGGPAERTADEPMAADVAVGGFGEVVAGARSAGYGARPGALAGALAGGVTAVGNGDLGDPAPAAVGYGRYTLLAAASPEGIVSRAATGDRLLTDDPAAPYGVRTDPRELEGALDDALQTSCTVAIVDQGDLGRADQFAMSAPPATEARDEALLAADGAIDYLLERLDPSRDLLMIVSPTSPAWSDEAHLGVAIAVGPGFDAGSSLESASTRRRGIVTLPDVAPTILQHLGIERPPAMNGRPFYATVADGDRIAEAVSLDDESTFVDGIKGPINAAYVVFQVIVYALILVFMRMRERRGGVGVTAQRWLEVAGLAVVAFPVATFLAGTVKGHELGALWFCALLVALDAALVAAASATLRGSLDRLLALTSFTLVVIGADLVLGSRLQLNTVFGYSPIVAGRFAGAGNIVFAVLGVTALMTGALIAYRWPRGRFTLALVAVLFAVVVVIDGAPSFGSDVGGVLALVPALAISWLLLSGRRPGIRVLVVAALAAFVALGLFLAWDLSRPASSQTHLARLYQDVVQRGWGTLVDTITRKASSNLRVFRSTIYTYFIPPALVALAYLLRRPSGRWQRLAVNFPRLRAGLIGGLVLAVLGFAVNDSGVVIPAVILSFLVPMALLVHLVMGES